MVVIEIQTTDRPLPHFLPLSVESRELFCLQGMSRMAELVRETKADQPMFVSLGWVFVECVSKAQSCPLEMSFCGFLQGRGNFQQGES